MKTHCFPEAAADRCHQLVMSSERRQRSSADLYTVQESQFASVKSNRVENEDKKFIHRVPPVAFRDESDNINNFPLAALARRYFVNFTSE